LAPPKAYLDREDKADKKGVRVSLRLLLLLLRLLLRDVVWCGREPTTQE